MMFLSPVAAVTDVNVSIVGDTSSSSSKSSKHLQTNPCDTGATCQTQHYLEHQGCSISTSEELWLTFSFSCSYYWFLLRVRFILVSFLIQCVSAVQLSSPCTSVAWTNLRSICVFRGQREASSRYCQQWLYLIMLIMDQLCKDARSLAVKSTEKSQ